MTQKFANNFKTTVAARLLTGGNILTIAPGDGAKLVAETGTLSVTDFVLLTLAKRSSGVETAWEIVKVIGRSTDDLTLDTTGSRNKESSSLLQWEIGESCSARLTRDSIYAPGAAASSVISSSESFAVAGGPGAVTLSTRTLGLGVGNWTVNCSGFVESNASFSNLVTTIDGTSSTVYNPLYDPSAAQVFARTGISGSRSITCTFAYTASVNQTGSGSFMATAIRES